MNRFGVMSAAVVLVVASMVNCSNEAPAGIPRPLPPIPDLVVDFPGASVDGKTVTIFLGDSLGCAFTLIPEDTSVLLGLSYDGRSTICFGLPGQKLVYWGDGGSPIIAEIGTHELKFQRYAPGGAQLGEPVIYTLVVLPRPESQLATGALLPRNRDQKYS